MATKNMSVRLDEELYDQFNEVLDELGIDFSTAVHIFVKQTVRERAIPFRVGKPKDVRDYEYEIATLSEE